jgi:hypothetical protein
MEIDGPETFFFLGELFFVSSGFGLLKASRGVPEAIAILCNSPQILVGAVQLFPGK